MVGYHTNKQENYELFLIKYYLILANHSKLNEKKMNNFYNYKDLDINLPNDQAALEMNDNQKLTVKIDH